MLTPFCAPSARAHWPEQLTKISHADRAGRWCRPPSTKPFSTRTPRDPRALEHLHAEVARALRQALREVRRVRLAVGRKPERALQVVAAQQRPLVQRLARREQVDVDAEAARHRRLALEHDPALGRARDVDAAALLPAGGEAGLALEARIELDAVLAHARHRAVRTHLADQPGRVPGGAAAEPPLLEQHDVAPAELRQVIGDAHADDAAADDDDLGLGGRRVHSRK